jgi:hypothetical protein
MQMRWVDARPDEPSLGTEMWPGLYGAGDRMAPVREMNGHRGRSRYKAPQRTQSHERHARLPAGRAVLDTLDSVKGPATSTEQCGDRAASICVGHLRWFTLRR